MGRHGDSTAQGLGHLFLESTVTRRLSSWALTDGPRRSSLGQVGVARAAHWVVSGGRGWASPCRRGFCTAFISVPRAVSPTRELFSSGSHPLGAGC